MCLFVGIVANIAIINVKYRIEKFEEFSLLIRRIGD